MRRRRGRKSKERKRESGDSDSAFTTGKQHFSALNLLMQCPIVLLVKVR
jgi:hypothetical protein